MKKIAVLLLILALLLVACEPVEDVVDPTEQPTTAAPIEEVHPYMTEVTLPFSEWYPNIKTVGGYTYYVNDEGVAYTTHKLSDVPSAPEFSKDWSKNSAIIGAAVSGNSLELALGNISTDPTVIRYIDIVREDEAYGASLFYSKALCRFSYEIQALDTSYADAVQFLNDVLGLELDAEEARELYDSAGSQYVYCYLSDALIVVLADNGISVTWYVADYDSISFTLVDTTEYESRIIPTEDGAVLVANTTGMPSYYKYVVNDVSESTEQTLRTQLATGGYVVYTDLYPNYIQATFETDYAYVTMMFNPTLTQYTYYTANVNYADAVKLLQHVYGFTVEEDELALAASYAYEHGVQVTLFDEDWVLAVIVEYMYDYPIINVYANYSKGT